MSNCGRNTTVYTTTPVATTSHLDIIGEPCSSEALNLLENFWPNVTIEMRNLGSEDFKTVELPLARIKKIMKLDEDVKMISAETPVLLAKAAEIFIQELTLRSWVHTEESRRRTLQRNDVATAISKCDQFDFLIDIVPREEANKPTTRRYSHSPNANMTAPIPSSSSDVQYVITLPQAVSTQPNQILQLGGQQPLVQVDASSTPSQIIQIPSSQAIQIHFTQPPVDEKPGTAILQVYGSENELISLTPQQLQQLFSNSANQSALILQSPGETQQSSES